MAEKNSKSLTVEEASKELEEIMAHKATKKELEKAYEDLTKAEKTISTLRLERDKKYKVEQILIAAGFLTREKIQEAEAIMDSLD